MGSLPSSNNSSNSFSHFYGSFHFKRPQISCRVHIKSPSASGRLALLSGKQPVQTVKRGDWIRRQILKTSSRAKCHGNFPTTTGKSRASSAARDSGPCAMESRYHPAGGCAWLAPRGAACSPSWVIHKRHKGKVEREGSFGNHQPRGMGNLSPRRSARLLPVVLCRG